MRHECVWLVCRERGAAPGSVAASTARGRGPGKEEGREGRTAPASRCWLHARARARAGLGGLWLRRCAQGGNTTPWRGGLPRCPPLPAALTAPAPARPCPAAQHPLGKFSARPHLHMTRVPPTLDTPSGRGSSRARPRTPLPRSPPPAQPHRGCSWQRKRTRTHTRTHAHTGAAAGKENAHARTHAHTHTHRSCSWQRTTWAWRGRGSWAWAWPPTPPSCPSTWSGGC